MLQKRLFTCLLILVLLLSFSACAPDYTDEFISMTERFSKMDMMWSELLDEEAAMNTAAPNFDTIDAFYDKAVAQATSDINELIGMIAALEGYKDGINALDYDEFMAVLSDSLNTTQVALECFEYDRGWIKAKSISDDYHAYADEWNTIEKSDKTTAVAQGYLTRMIELKEKLDSIQNEIDVETYEEMSRNLDSAIEAFSESIQALEAAEAK
ncbi:MAG: hypothetical protein AB1Z19_00850 [Eubacteriales bacterium]